MCHAGCWFHVDKKPTGAVSVIQRSCLYDVHCRILGVTELFLPSSGFSSFRWRVPFALRGSMEKLGSAGLKIWLVLVLFVLPRIEYPLVVQRKEQSIF